MLRVMRKNAQSWVVKFVFGVIIVVFSFWGVGSMKARQMNLAASVDGKSIERKTLDNSFRQLWQRYQDQARGKFNPDEARVREIKQEALNGLIDRQLLLRQAEKFGLMVSEEELRGRIAAIPAFQTDGHFDAENYRRALSYNRLTPAQFEQSLREDLLLEKVRLLIADGVKVLPEEVDILLARQNEEIKVELLKLEPSAFLDKVVADDAAIEKYFQAHREDFRVPLKRSAAVLVLQRSKLLESIPVEAAAVEKYYQENTDKFKVEEQVKARHILIKPDGEDEAQAEAAALKRIQELEQALADGADFVELAKKESQGPSASSGGDLGWFGHGAMVKPFEDAAFALQPGEVSSPVQTRFGFHLIKLEDRREARTKTLDEVRAGIEKGLRAQAYPEVLEQKLAEVEKEMAGATLQDFITRSKGLGYMTVETGLFAERDQIVPDIGRDQALLAEVFKNPVGSVAKQVNPGRNSYYFMVTEEKPSYLPELAEVKADAGLACRREMARARVQELKPELEKQLAAGKSLADCAAEFGVELVDSGFFVRGRGAIPKIGVDEKLNLTLFTLKENQVSPVLSFKEMVFAARLMARRQLETEKTVDLKKQLEDRLVEYKVMRLMNEYVSGLRQAADIKVMAGVLD